MRIEKRFGVAFIVSAVCWLAKAGQTSLTILGHLSLFIFQVKISDVCLLDGEVSENVV